MEFYKLQQEKKRYLVVQTKDMATKQCEKIYVFRDLIVVMESVEAWGKGRNLGFQNWIPFPATVRDNIKIAF